jgi:D-alanyl-D-alanine carboxypeptidase/D-alanyl-D-alanine-endopeptidase (penicillin-binding protein 4)
MADWFLKRLMNTFYHNRHLHIVTVICLLNILFCPHTNAQDTQMPAPLRQFIRMPMMQGASVSFLAKEVKSGEILYGYDTERKLTPASVTKTVTTAVALELLGKDFRFGTSIQYDGVIRNGVLEGNLFICGSGDPTFCSSETAETAKDSILLLWVSAVEKANIRKINGKIIADESIFDTEGVSMKWLREDLGSNYGQGSYGINIFDNLFKLYLNTGNAGTKPSVSHCEPSMPSLKFYNYLTTQSVSTDSFYITGFPYTYERYLYGVVRSGHNMLKIEGDIPDPPLFAAQYFLEYLKNRGIEIAGEATCHRLLTQAGECPSSERKILITTYSPPLEEIVRIINFISYNMYADALVKTLGLRYRPPEDETISSFERGTKIVVDHWTKKGLNTRSLCLYDGSGLASTNKVTTSFLCDMYIYMAKKSDVFIPFFNSFPRVGADGTVRSFLKGSKLEGNRLKSGSMSNVQCYGGYIIKDDKQYAVALLVNNFSGKNKEIRTAIETLFLSLF